MKISHDRIYNKIFKEINFSAGDKIYKQIFYMYELVRLLTPFIEYSDIQIAIRDQIKEHIK